MLIDNITIIICIVVLLLTVVSVVANPFFRSVKSNRSYKEEGCELPPITVVVLSQNDVEALDKHLPLLFDHIKRCCYNHAYSYSPILRNSFTTFGISATSHTVL